MIQFPAWVRALADELDGWLSLATIWLLFELPAAVRSSELELSAVRFSLELPLLLTVWALNEAYLRSRPLRYLVRVFAVILLVLRIDQWICQLLMREEPLLYDQWFMIRHFGILIGDLMSPTTALILLGAALTGGLLAQLVRWLLKRGRKLLSEPRRGRAGKLAIALWSALLAGSAAWAKSPDPVLTWQTPAVARNLQRSREVYRSVNTGLTRSPYVDYDEIALRDRPDVLLFIVESYGRLIFVDPAMREVHAQLLRELSGSLERAGWYAASAFSTAPVSGSRSWLAEGTMLMGTPIRYEAVFQHLLSQTKRPPTLVRFLNRQGYETVLLAPADRNRPGVSVTNRYGFSRLLTYEDLGYRGPRLGWGIVPDQYSLAVAEQRVLRSRARPVFLDFHMVSSHAPWSDIPELVENPLASGQVAHTAPRLKERSGVRAALSQLERYARPDESRFAYMERIDAGMRAGYQATISYDLRLIAEYLERRAEDALVIMIGDHQPPVVARGDDSFDAPIHVLTRTRERLRALLQDGFLPSLELPPSRPPTLSHAGLFSLLVQTLAASCADCEAPPALPMGYRLVEP